MFEVDPEVELESDEERVEVDSDRVEVSEVDDASPVVDADEDLVVEEYSVEEEEGPMVEEIPD